MKVKKTTEVKVCDFCEQEGSIRECEICGAEACPEHMVKIEKGIRVKGRLFSGSNVILSVCDRCFMNSSVKSLIEINIKIDKIKRTKKYDQYFED